jgi:hypothetical protein
MAGVTRVELAPDAPEPGDDVLVRDNDGCRWARVDGRWLPLLDNSNANTDLSPWRVLVDQYGPLSIPDEAAEREGRDAARDELDTRHMAAHLAVEHHKIALELTTDAALIGTAAAIAAFLRDGAAPGGDS